MVLAPARLTAATAGVLLVFYTVALLFAVTMSGAARFGTGEGSIRSVSIFASPRVPAAAAACTRVLLLYTALPLLPLQPHVINPRAFSRCSPYLLKLRAMLREPAYGPKSPVSYDAYFMALKCLSVTLIF